MNIKGMIIDRKVKIGTDGKSKQAGFRFPPGESQAMFEEMSTCCGDESRAFGHRRTA
jgi:hypothetical protein